MENLLLSYTTEELDAMLVKYGKVPTIANPIVEEKERRIGQAGANKAAFEAKAQVEIAKLAYKAGIEKLASKIPGPVEGEFGSDYIHLKWADVDDTSKLPELVCITDTPAVVGADGFVSTPAVTHTDKRYPKIKKWVVVETFTTPGNALKSSRNTSSDAGKGTRVGTAYFGETLLGEYKNGNEACIALQAKFPAITEKLVEGKVPKGVNGKREILLPLGIRWEDKTV